MENSSEIPAHGIYLSVKHFLQPVTLRKMELFKVKIATQRRSISTVGTASDLRQALNKSVYAIYEQLGPVVQSFVRSFSAPNIKCANIFCWKNVRSFCTAKAPHIFSAKNGSVFIYNLFEILTSH